jgi:hypothetical protein
MATADAEADAEAEAEAEDGGRCSMMVYPSLRLAFAGEEKEAEAEAEAEAVESMPYTARHPPLFISAAEAEAEAEAEADGDGRADAAAGSEGVEVAAVAAESGGLGGWKNWDKLGLRRCTNSASAAACSSRASASLWMALSRAYSSSFAPNSSTYKCCWDEAEVVAADERWCTKPRAVRYERKSLAKKERKEEKRGKKVRMQQMYVVW